MQTIAPTAWNNHHEIRTDNTEVIRALEKRVGELAAVAGAAARISKDSARPSNWFKLDKALKAAGYLGGGENG